MKLGWGIVVAAFVLVGCEADFSRCSERDDAGECIFDDFPGLDGSLGLDAGDAATTSDAARPDGASDAGLGGMDSGGSGADASGPLTAAGFCDLQLARARAWLDFLESTCACFSSAERNASADFLSVALGYDDSVGAACITNTTGLQQRTTLAYNVQSAASCATRFAEQFAGPPASCSAGFDPDLAEAMVGHGVQQLAQLPECRATFTGKVARDATCVDSFDCAGGLRCLPLPGASDMGGGVPKSCQPARGNLEPCANRSDCADGLICVRSDSSATGANCIPTTELRTVNGPCRASRECEVGLVCDCPAGDCSRGSCVTAPTSAPICKP